MPNFGVNNRRRQQPPPISVPTHHSSLTQRDMMSRRELSATTQTTSSLDFLSGTMDRPQTRIPDSSPVISSLSSLPSLPVVSSTPSCVVKHISVMREILGEQVITSMLYNNLVNNLKQITVLFQDRLPSELNVRVFITEDDEELFSAPLYDRLSVVKVPVDKFRDATGSMSIIKVRVSVMEKTGKRVVIVSNKDDENSEEESEEEQTPQEVRGVVLESVEMMM